MGQKAARRQKFLTANPYCFFCGDAATTIDHIPNRECFDNRVWPEGYEFPACRRCNSEAAGAEQIVALYANMTNFQRGVVTDQGRKLLDGVRNNAPNALPDLDVRASQKRATFRRFGMVKDAATPWMKTPVARIGPEQQRAFRHFARRLTCALYYKHMGEILPKSHIIRTYDTLAYDRRAEVLIEYAMENFPNGELGERQNTDLGDQFLYLWFFDRHQKVFTFVAQLATTLLFVGVATPPGMDDGEKVDSFAHADDFPPAKP